jgi:thiol-disulfide isomerase/thioredoxin
VKKTLTALAAAAALFVPSLAMAASPSFEPVLAAPASDWLNGHVTAADLRGKVVIVDVFTFDCINCKHVTPELRKLHANLPASDFAIVGVHTPELPEERVRTNVVSELARQGVVWPVAIDNSQTIWNALNNEYWPTQYIFDRQGHLRQTVVGEGQDELVEQTVRSLMAERSR